VASKPKKEKSEKDSTQEILSIARRRFDLCVVAEREIREEGLDDLLFRAGEQWPADIKASRDLDNRPCLTINRLPQFVRQVTNDQRQNRPSIKVSPVDDKADPDTAKVFQGLIRNIERNSNADVAYDTGFEGGVTKGFGYWRVLTAFSDPFSFKQEIKIKRIRNSFTVYLDPHYQEPDASDANYGFVFEDMSHDDYKAKYPNSQLASMTDWKSIGDNMPGWSDSSTYRVAEYFYKTFKEVDICLLSDGSVVEKSKLPKVMPEGLTVVKERKTTLPAIKWCKLNAVEVLEETDWPGQWIPIVPVLGDELDIDGRKVLEGVIRHAKDPQRMYNYWASSETETIALAPRAPFIGAEGQFEGHMAAWKTANTKNHAFLQYKPKTFGGQLAPPPQRQTYEPAVQAITQARMQSADDLKATTGIYDAALGNRSNEISGRAIEGRRRQAEVSNFHLIDNLSRAIRHTGRILVDLIPYIYDVPDVIRILGEDGEPEMVQINQIFTKDGKQIAHNFGIGKYDVNVSVGPSYASKRQEAAESMMDFTKALPQQASLVLDLIAKNLDWPGADLFAERFKKSLPPGIAEEKDGEKQPLPPEAQQQMQKMSQMIEQLTGKLNEAHDTIDKDLVKVESTERIAMKKLQVEAEIEMMKVGSKESIILLQAQIGELQNRFTNQLRGNQPIETENESSMNQPGAGQSLPTAPQPLPTGGQPSPGLTME
jgi:hypothetical protein